MTVIELQTDIEGKTAYFGQLKDKIEDHGYVFGGSWDYDKGSFDSILLREGGETIYVRVPFHVLEGVLDGYDALIKFEKPYVIKHIVHIGLDKDGHSLLTATGLHQFQEPIDTDGSIKNKSKWEEAGIKSVNEIMKYIV